MRRLHSIAAVALLASACVSDKPAPAEPSASTTGTVEASGTANTFTPQTLTVLQGGTVTWQFSTRPHNVTFVATAGAPQNVPTSTNTQISRTFTTPGTFAYACTLHSGMIGTVTVKAPPAAR